MKNSTLKERMETYRNLTDYKLSPNSYVIAMVDGHCFSKMVKNKYKLPFDDTFISHMNATAEYVCKQIQGCKFAYTQSDEISFLITDFDTPTTDAYFGYRLCKLQSLIASYATSEFNRQCMLEISKTPCSSEDMAEMINNYTPVVFDCKCWTVPTYNDAYAWFLYRQNDCVRNSKQQASQTYLPKKKLFGMKCDEQIKWLKDEKGIDWDMYDDGKKYGRIIYKEEYQVESINPIKNGEPEIAYRYHWVSHNTTPFSDERHIIKHLIPNREKKLNTVFVVSSKYSNGLSEVNAVYAKEEGAVDLKKYMLETEGFMDDVEIEKCNINEMCIL